MRSFRSCAIAFIPWAIVTGIAMRSIGLSTFESMAMSLLVFSGTAQLGSLPLIASGAPLWLVFATGAVMSLRFVIYSAALAPAFAGQSWAKRAAGSYLLVDGGFSLLAPRMLQSAEDDPSPEAAAWRFGYFLVPSLFGWVIWQVFTGVGVVGAELMPRDWSLEFMATIALLVTLVPVSRARPMLVAAVVGGLGAVFLRGLPLRLGLVVAIVLGMAAGFAAEHGKASRTPA